MSTSTTALGVLAEAGRAGNFEVDIVNGWGYYVSAISGHTASGFDGWTYRINGIDPYVGMNDYVVKSGDTIDVAYSVWEWKIGANVPTTTVDSPVVFTAAHYASGTWAPAPSTTISIANENFITNENGEYAYTTNTTGTVSAYVFGTNDWPQNSPAVNVEFLPAPTNNTSTEPTSNPNNGGSSPGNTNQPVDQASINTAANKIIDYLKSQQDASGKIIDGGTTDWAIMAFGSQGIYANTIKNSGASLLDFAKNYQFTDSSDLNVCASYPRHLLALMAAGVSATDETITNLTAKIKTDCFADSAFGQAGINDDIFGLIALLAAGENPDQPIISTMVNTITADQTSAGAFTWGGYPGADITGAAVNALNYAQKHGANIDDTIFTKAKNYLKTNQLSDGGWGYDISDALTTSWAVMGINELGENQNDWFSASGKNPWHILANQLKSGFYESVWAPGVIDWFATKHALPALVGASWPIILTPQTQAASGNLDSSNNQQTTTTTPTSTLPVSTSTISIPTSTFDLASSTITIVTGTVNVTGDEMMAPVAAISDKSLKANFTATQNNRVTARTTDTISTTTMSTNLSANQLLNDPTNNLIDQLPLDTATRQTAKKIMLVSGGGATTLGLYLGLKLLKTLI